MTDQLKQSYDSLHKAIAEKERATEIFNWLIEYETSSSWLVLILPSTLAVKYFNWKVKRKLANLTAYYKFIDKTTINENS